ncbi:hypothetical protein, partial [Chromobacterium subtsugae]
WGVGQTRKAFINLLSKQIHHDASLRVSEITEAPPAGAFLYPLAFSCACVLSSHRHTAAPSA